MLTTALMKLLTVKSVTAAAVLTTVAGGVAVAAGTGQVSDLVQVGDRAGIASAPAGAGQTAGDRSKNGSSKQHAGGPADAAGSPSPSLVGLCHAVSAGNKDEHGKALQSPAFRALVTTAGGADKVDAFCKALLAEKQNGAKPDKGTKSDKPDEDAKVGPSHPADNEDGQPGSGQKGGASEEHRTVRPTTPAGP